MNETKECSESPPPPIARIYDQISSTENLELAFNKARRKKTTKKYVIDFEANLKENLDQLRNELLLQTYYPKPLETFILRDPKTRKISKSDFRDRVIHHAICNIIEPIFDKTFIYDSFANRRRKGTFNAIKRFDTFKRKVSRNNTRTCFVLKADIRHYFDNVDHKILLNILNKRIKCPKTLELINIILRNHRTERKGKGMPLGNLTSQFLANVYLNELDQYIKHELKVKYYTRYVDDFVILHTDLSVLADYKSKIDEFLKNKLALELHPDKSKIIPLEKGIGFLGFRIFYHHKLVRKKNLKRFQRRLKESSKQYKEGLIEREEATQSLEGWFAYIQHANTFKHRKDILSTFNHHFPLERTHVIKNIQRQERFRRKIEASKVQFSSQKTLFLLKKGLTIQDIAKKRGVKESTVWEHFAKLIEYNQLNLYRIVPKEKVIKIRTATSSKNDSLKEIKARLPDKSTSYNEIACVLASTKANASKKSIHELVTWYQRTNCRRKCCFNTNQISTCKEKFKTFITKNPNLEMTKKEFIHLFNNNMTICVLPEREKRRVVSVQNYLSMREKANR